MYKSLRKKRKVIENSSVELKLTVKAILFNSTNVLIIYLVPCIWSVLEICWWTMERVWLGKGDLKSHTQKYKCWVFSGRAPLNNLENLIQTGKGGKTSRGSDIEPRHGGWILARWVESNYRAQADAGCSRAQEAEDRWVGSGNLIKFIVAECGELGGEGPCWWIRSGLG